MNLRIIPVLTVLDGELVKTTRFAKPQYLGDPINAVKLFNDLEVDEISILDISPGRHKKGPDFNLLSEIADQAFMPLSYGGGIATLQQARDILRIGAEKVVVSSQALANPELITQISSDFGSQSLIVSVDVKKNFFGRKLVYSHSGRRKTKWLPQDWCQKVEALGAGEILLHSIDNDGTRGGLDLELIAATTKGLSIPLIACGGASSLQNLTSAYFSAGASAVAAGSLFVFQGSTKGILINFPSRSEILQEFRTSPQKKL